MAMKKIKNGAPVVLGVLIAGGITFFTLGANAEEEIYADVPASTETEQTMKIEQFDLNDERDDEDENEAEKVSENENYSEDIDTANIAEESKKEVVERKDLNKFLFIGDSFTFLLKNTIESNNDTAYVHAKSGSTPSDWIDKVADMPDADSVEGIVLLIGVNGAGTQANREDVVTLMNTIKNKYPDKNVYVQKVFPVGENFKAKGFNQKIDILNEIIENHVKTLDNFTFIDTTDGFVDDNGNLIHTYDELHISPDYHQQQYNNILKAVQEAEKNK